MDSQNIPLNRMYNDLAYLWPLLSPPQDYAEEAQDWLDLLQARLGSERVNILELGVGGGHNLSHLTPFYQATAVDLSEAMLQHSKQLNPEVEHHLGDMRTIRLGRRFKAVLIHDAISHLTTIEDLKATLNTAAIHLEPGGLLIIAPDDFKDTFTGPYTTTSINSDGATELTFIEHHHDPNPDDNTIETIMFYLIKENGHLKIENDRMLCGLFSLNRWLDLMRAADFKSETYPCKYADEHQEHLFLVGTLIS